MLEDAQIVCKMNPKVVLDQLELALHPNPVVQQEAMRRLQLFEDQPLFISSLIYILQSPGCQPNLRLLSVICLKNIVHRVWVNRGGLDGDKVYIVSKDEKALLRDFLLGAVAESDRKVSLHLSVLIAKVARQDWPSAWPNLLPDLYKMIPSGPTWVSRKNAMIYFRRILNELSQKKIAGAKQQLLAVGNEIFPSMASLWRDLTAKFRECFDRPSSFTSTDDSSEIEENCMHLTECIGILALLLQRCFDSLCRAPFISSFFDMFASDMQFYAATLRSNATAACEIAGALHWEDELSDDSDAGDGPEDGNPNDVEEGPTFRDGRSLGAPAVTLRVMCRLRFMLNSMAAVPVKLQKQYQLQIIPFLRPFLDLYYAQIIDGYGLPSSLDLYGAEPLGPHLSVRRSPDKFKQLHGLTKQAVLFLSNVFSCSAYTDDPAASRAANSGSKASAHDALAQGLAATATINGFLTSPSARTPDAGPVIDVLLLLVLNSLVRLAPADIVRWAEDAEELLLMEEGETESDSVRTAAQGLFYGLIERCRFRCKSAIRRILWQLSQNARLPIAEGVTSAVAWEAVFMCAGLSGDKLFPHTFQGFSEDKDETAETAVFSNADEFIDSVLLPIIERFVLQAGEAARDDTPHVMLRRLLWLLNCWMYMIPADCTDIYSRILNILIFVVAPEASSSALAHKGGSSSAASRRPMQFDLVTALQAASTLQSLFNSDVLDTPALYAHFTGATTALCRLTSRFEEPELCAKVIAVLNDVVGAICGRTLVNQAGAIRLREAGFIYPLMMHLLGLWSGSHESSPVRSGVLDVLIRLARSAGKSSLHRGHVSGDASPAVQCSCCLGAEVASSNIHNVLLHLISIAASGRSGVAHLTAQAIELWLIILRNSARYTPEMDAVLTSCMTRLFAPPAATAAAAVGMSSPVTADEDGGDLDVTDLLSSDMQSVFHAVEASAVLHALYSPAGEPVFVVRYESVLVLAYRRVLGQLRDQAVISVVRPLEVLLITAPNETALFLVKHDILQFMLRACFGTPLTNTFPRGEVLLKAFAKSEDSVLAIVSYLHIIARVLLFVPDAFSHAVASCLNPLGVDSGIGLDCVVHHLIENFDSVGYDNMTTGYWRKRLWAFAMLSLYPTVYSPLYEIFADVAATCDGLHCGDPFSAMTHDSAADTINLLAHSILKTGTSREDEDETVATSDDGAEHEFDSAIAGMGSHGPIHSPDKKGDVDSIQCLFGIILSRDKVLLNNLESYVQEKLTSVRSAIGVDHYNRLLG
jgi:hypothetical protein